MRMVSLNEGSSWLRTETRVLILDMNETVSSSKFDSRSASCHERVLRLHVARTDLDLFHLFLLLDVDLEELLEATLGLFGHVVEVDPKQVFAGARFSTSMSLESFRRLSSR